MPFIDQTTSPAFVLKAAIQLEIPGLSPVEPSRRRFSRKVPLRKNKNFATSSKQNVAVDPRQLKLGFIDA
jgi:hypothetical protein